MKNAITRAVLGFAALSTMGTFGPGSTAPDDEALRGELGTALDAYLERLAGFQYAGAAAVSKGGKIALLKGYGLADRETGRPVTTDTVFSIGSITKQFTGAAILKLEMAGELCVEDRIVEYLDDVPADKQGITLHHLLTHTAGFPGGIGDDFEKIGREALLAGRPPGQVDAPAVALGERTLELVEWWIGGDATGLHEAMGEAVPLEELEAGLAEFRTRREAAHGELHSASIASSRRDSGAVRVIVTFHHERAQAWAAFTWEQDELVDLAPIRELPATTLPVFPVAEDEFTSFSLRSPLRLELRFRSTEGGAASLVFALPSGEFELTR